MFAFAPDEKKVILIGDLRVALVNRRTGKSVALPSLKSCLRWLQFAPDGSRVACILDNHIQMRTFPDFSLRYELTRCWGTTHTFAFHPTAPIFAALNRDGVLTLYNLETGEVSRSMDFALGRNVKCVTFAPDGLTCAVGGSNSQFAVFDVDV
jgi:WD40 repeat protein